MHSSLGRSSGPDLLGWLEPANWPWSRNTILIEVARVTLVVVDLGVAIQLARDWTASPFTRWFGQEGKGGR